MKIKKFKCGLCKQHEQYYMTRIGLRKHLREKHLIKTGLANGNLGDRKAKRRWWIVEDFN